MQRATLLLLGIVATFSLTAQELPQVANAVKFSEEQLISGLYASGASQVRNHDVDGDGDLDIVYTAYNSNAVMWVENEGGASFGAPRFIDTELSQPNSLAIGDLNGDSIPDLVVASENQNAARTYLGGSPIDTTTITFPVVTDIARTQYNAAILTEDGEVRVFGRSAHNALAVPQFSSTVVDIEVAHPEGAFVALLEDGTAESWGYNDCSSLDDSFYEAMTTFDRGYRFAMGVSEDGSIDYRGCNYCNSEATPPGNDFVDVWVDHWDRRFAGAIREDGSIVMWGCESGGSHNIPPTIVSGSFAVADADAGYDFTVALSTDGRLMTWGRNDYSIVSNTPGDNDFTAMDAGYHHAIALKSDGSVVVWGRNEEGQLNTPLFDAPVVKIGAGMYSNWAITESGHAYIWGYDNEGSTVNASLFTEGLTQIEPRTFQDIARSHYNTCYLTTEGDIVVTGSTSHGVLNVPYMPGTVVDVQVAHPEGAFAATLADGSVITWGYNNCNSLESDWLESVTQWDRNYRFNIGINPDSSLAFQGCSYCNAGVLPLDSDFVYVWTDYWDQRFAGAIHEDGTLEMWGCEGSGNFNIPNDLGPVAKAESGHWWTLSLLQDGSLRSWGWDGYNLNNPPSGNDFVDIDAGYTVGIALRSNGTIATWGENNQNAQSMPDFDGPVVKIGAGMLSYWAITESGRAYVWGYDNNGSTAYNNIVNSGAYQPESSLTSGSGFTGDWLVTSQVDVKQILLEDMDGDGDLDVLSAECDYGVAWYANNGDGSFDGERHLIQENMGCVYSITTGDLDLDGDNDVITYLDNGQIGWHKRNADGSFEDRILVGSWGNGRGVEVVAMPGDLYPDIFVRQSTGDFNWWRNPGPTGDWQQNQYLDPRGGGDDRAFWVGNLLGDDGVDVVTTTEEHGYSTLEISRNINNVFDEPWSAAESPSSGGYQDLDVADLDGDGLLDITVADYLGRIFWVKQETSTAPALERQVINTDNIDISQLRHYDFDGDGYDELISVERGSDRIRIYPNAEGVLGDPYTIISSLDATRIDIGPIDGDTIPDILIAGGDNHVVRYLPGNGDGTFGELQVVSQAPQGNYDTYNCRDVALGDLDGDGDLDVVAASEGDDKFSWYKNLGGGNFGPQQVIANDQGNAYGIKLLDVDSDGDLDVIGLTRGSELKLFTNEGGGAFGSAMTIGSGFSGPIEFITADLTGNGHEDLIVANNDSDGIEYIPNLGGGAFGSKVIVSRHADNTQSVWAADLDQDGDLDLLGATYNDNKVFWHENLGEGDYGHQQTFSIGEVADQEGPLERSLRYRSVLAYDADLDGTLEVFGGGYYSLDMWGTLPVGNVGCTDIEACNYDATAEFDFGCNYECYGCTQPTAINFDSDAIEDDLSCLTPLGGCANIAGQYEYCFGNNVDTVITLCPVDPSAALTMDILFGELEYLADYMHVYNGTDTTAEALAMDLNGTLDGLSFTSTDASGCLTLHIITDGSLSCGSGVGAPINFVVACGFEEYSGCTDPAACNYNPDATIEDGSCATVDCMGVCDGSAVLDAVCGQCLDLDEVVINTDSIEIDNGVIQTVASYGSVGLGFNYTKVNYASNDSSNWDWISDDVALFRNNNQGLFNAVSQSGWQENITGTLWGPPGSFDLTEFTSNWRTLQCNLYNDCSYSNNLPGNHQTLYIQSTGEFFDIEYTSWQCCQAGGGFAYTRTKYNDVVIKDQLVVQLEDQGYRVEVDTVRYDYTGDYETHSVPTNAVWTTITARGANGGISGRYNQNSRKRGALIRTHFESGELPSQLKLAVGEGGINGGSTQPGYYSAVYGQSSGGGGTFIASLANGPILVAGGGGGGGYEGSCGARGDASLTEVGDDGCGCTNQYSDIGFAGASCQGRGGQGFFDGFINGFSSYQNSTFGGGGASPSSWEGGGGGGYSGGSGAQNSNRMGGGGGSYLSGFASHIQHAPEQIDGKHGYIEFIHYKVVGSNCTPGCMDEGACNYDPIAVEDDGTCEYVTCAGCADAGACNYDETVTIPANDQCEYLTCAGCQDDLACNYDETATIDAADCIYAEDYQDCDGNCYNDFDGDGVCDEAEVPGCTYPGADNYDAAATDEDGSCEFAGIEDVFGCVYATACNYDPAATADDGSCEYATLGYDCDGNCLFDTDGDGICNEYEGCTNPAACNYDPQAQDNDGSCVFPATGYDCDGECLVDNDGDGVCDPFEFAGCTDALACNYYAEATDDDGSCTYAAFGYDCDGYCLGDVDSDGVCDANEIEGCTLSTACNYDPNATDNDGSCVFPEPYRDCEGNCLADVDGDGVCNEDEIGGCIYPDADNYNPQATDDDGSCVFDGLNSVPGCFYSTACNYQPDATVDDGSCVYPPAGYDCDGNCIVDTDGDGVCNQFEVSGCTEEGACNYDSDATDNDGTCEYYTCAGCQDVDACNYDPDAVLVGTCDYDSCAGCQDDQACNYDSLATLPADCTFPDPGLDCDGNCLVDENEDGQCDQLPGCTDPEALNYQPEATDNDGSCIYPCNLCLPVFDVVPEHVTVGCADELPSAPGTYTAYNPCTDEVIDVLALTVTSSNTACSEFITFRYLATNSACGNFTEYTQTYSVLDTIAPEITSLPVGLELSCDDTDDLGDADVVAVDGCTAVSLSYSVDTLAGACPSTYTLVRTVTAVDVCGNETTGQYTIAVVDTTGPAFTSVPADLILDCEAAWPTDGATAEDNCTTWDVTLEEFTQEGSCPGKYTLFRSFEATDACGNVTSAVQTVSYVDTIAPAILTVPADVQYSCEAYIYEDLVTASDLCSEVTREFNDIIIAGDCPQEYTIERTHSVTDGCGNVSAALQTITVVDTVAPVFTSAAPFVVTDCTNQNAPLAAATDPCGTTNLTFSTSPAVDPNVPGQELRLYTASDECGNSVQMIQVVDYTDVASCGGCTNSTATNYDPSASIDDGSCEFADGYNDFGECIADTDGDGICDPYELSGCQDDEACNYNPAATDAGPCAYPATGYDCDGACTADADGDGVCDANEVLGCTDASACNYAPLATEEDSSCDYSCKGCMYDAATNYDSAATADDGSCTFDLEDPCPTDLNSDGQVGIEDLLEVLGNFGSYCE